ncbi:hypothetical protein [Leptobacterium sp. I13]|uniref:hypothetical protein n=1 Tax=Leptobacterium meishanense TaxID=3128904 RepID=UPI0030EE7A8F
MKKAISLNGAIAIIDKVDGAGKAVPFDIAFRSLQRNSKTGGKFYEYKQARKFRSEKSNKHLSIKTVQTAEIIKRNPNHFHNRTRNLVLQNGDIKKIHIRLIISINGQKVIY